MKLTRTIEDYKRAGAWLRLLKTILAETHVSCCDVLSKNDCMMFDTITKRVNAICSKAEDNMFKDHPELSNDALDIFYGSADCSTRTDTDDAQVRLMQELIVNMFGTNWTADIEHND